MVERSQDLTLSQISELENFRFSVLKCYLRNDDILEMANLMEQHPTYQKNVASIKKQNVARSVKLRNLEQFIIDILEKQPDPI